MNSGFRTGTYCRYLVENLIKKIKDHLTIIIGYFFPFIPVIDRSTVLTSSFLVDGFTINDAHHRGGRTGIL